MTISSYVDRLNAILLPFLEQRVAELGEREAGAYNFYVQRLARNNLLGSYEIKLAERLLARNLPVSAIHEIGPGYGQLTFLLAMAGLPALAIEIDQRRYMTGAAMLEALVKAMPEMAPPRCALIKGGFPLPVSPGIQNTALALATNLVYTTSAEQQNIIVAAMKQYKYTLIDVDRFFEKRTTDAERAPVFAMFAHYGFAKPEDFLDLGDDGRYYLFKPAA